MDSASMADNHLSPIREVWSLRGNYKGNLTWSGESGKASQQKRGQRIGPMDK